jgi:hypothetical protein
MPEPEAAAPGPAEPIAAAGAARGCSAAKGPAKPRRAAAKAAAPKQAAKPEPKAAAPGQAEPAAAAGAAPGRSAAKGPAKPRRAASHLKLVKPAGAAAVPAYGANCSNEQVDVARRLLELSETIKEATAYLIGRAAQADVSMTGNMLRNIGEGLVSLEHAVLSVRDSIAPDGEEAQGLSEQFFAITEKMEAIIDSYATGNYGVLNRQLLSFDGAYSSYDSLLLACFKGVTLM